MSEQDPTDTGDRTGSGGEIQDLQLDVRSVLAEIGAEEAVAQLAARVEGLEQELERSESRTQEAERARRGELDVMRARVSDALAAIQESIDEQRAASGQLERRLAEVVTASEERASSSVSALREELTPRVHQATAQADEVQARLTGDLQALAEDLEHRIEAASQAVTQSRSQLQSSLDELRQALETEQATRDSALGELDGRLQARVEQLERGLEERDQESSAALEALRRELDAAVGELRASLNLRAQQLEETVGEVRSELVDTLDAHATDVAELERRWIEGTRDIARRIEQVDAEARSSVDAERVAREDADAAVTERLDRVAGAVDGLEDRLATETTRHGTQLEGLRRTLDEVRTNLDAVQRRVSTETSRAVDDLDTRVSGLAGEVEALRDTGVRQEQRLAGLDRLSRRVGELATAQQDLAARIDAGGAAPAAGASSEDVAALRRDVGTLAGIVESAVGRVQEASDRLTSVETALRDQEQLRREVRDLTTRGAELYARVQEAERIARTAGQAIAGAVRKARLAEERARQQPSLPPADADAPTVPAAEQQPLFLRTDPSTAEPDPPEDPTP